MELKGEFVVSKKVSLVIPCRNEHPNLEPMFNSLKKTVYPNLAEIIVVDDGSEDEGTAFLKDVTTWNGWCVKLLHTAHQGPSRARNHGAHNSSGEIVIFCDGHLLFDDPFWINKLVASFSDATIGAVCPAIYDMGNPNAIGFGGTVDSYLTFSWLAQPDAITEVPIGPGGCIAIRKDVFQHIGGFEKNFFSWGLEDVEISIKMWLYGYKIVVNPHVAVAHLFRTKHPTPVHYIDVDYNLLWMAICHFNQRRLVKTIDMVNKRGNFSKNLKQLHMAQVWEYSTQYRANRQLDDDWYFKKFNISF